MAESTCYSRLNKSSRDIRLLILQPTLHADNRLQATVVVKSLASDPEYEALSYTWGEPDDFGFKIWVNGIKVSIRQNLLCALRVLRRDTERILWIDALCIDQDDDTERNHQVGLMGDIYRKAVKVISWLGTPDLSELRNIKLDTEIGGARSTRVPAFDYLRLSCGESFTRATDGSGKKRKLDNKQLEGVSLQDFPLEDTRSEIIEICNLDYWTRMWIVQEICLASQIELLYGTNSIDWNILGDYITAIAANRFLNPQYIKAIGTSYASAVYNIAHHTYTHQYTYEDKFKEMIELTINFSCHDRKDKIYALLGLQNHSIKEALQVNYSSSLYDLYCKVMDTWIALHESVCPEWHDSNFDEIASFSKILQSSLLRPADVDDGCQVVFSSQRGLSIRNHTFKSWLKLKARRIDIIGNVADQMTDLACQLATDKCSVWVDGGEFYRSSARDTCSDSWTTTKKTCWEVDQDKLALFSYIDYRQLNDCSFKGESDCNDDPSDQKFDYEETSNGLSFFLTISGITGLVPKGTMPGDELWQLEMTDCTSSWLVVRVSFQRRHHILGRAVVANTMFLQYTNNEDINTRSNTHPQQANTSMLAEIHGRIWSEPSWKDTVDIMKALDGLHYSLHGAASTESEAKFVTKREKILAHLDCHRYDCSGIKSILFPVTNFSPSFYCETHTLSEHSVFMVPMPLFQVLTCPFDHHGVDSSIPPMEDSTNPAESQTPKSSLITPHTPASNNNSLAPLHVGATSTSSHFRRGSPLAPMHETTSSQLPDTNFTTANTREQRNAKSDVAASKLSFGKARIPKIITLPKEFEFDFVYPESEEVDGNIMVYPFPQRPGQARLERMVEDSATDTLYWQS